MTVVAEAQARLGGLLDRLLPAGAPVALLGLPVYGNAGDAAIWLGAEEELRRRGHRVVDRSGRIGFSERRLRNRLPPGGVVLFTGGGNLGDLYPAHQGFRERVVEALRDRRIVQLPQTVHFDHERSIERVRRSFEGHPDLTLCVRDQPSLELVRDSFDVPVVLAPDTAFGLGPLSRAGQPRWEILALARRDKGATTEPPADAAVPRRDWGDRAPGELPGHPLALAAHRALARVAGRARPWLAATPAAVTRIDRLARATLEAQLHHAVRLLSAARVVVTNRLHGHILCLLLGIPHVIRDNRFGKVSAYHRTWTSTCPLVVWADGPTEATERARELLRDLR